MMQTDEHWLTINDAGLSAAELERETARRVQQRRQVLGTIHPTFPEFGTLSPMPELSLQYAALAHHLQMANELEPPPMSPVLAESPATRMPLLGSLWQLVRRQFHELILFYVNRSASHETRLDNHLISALNELTRIVQEQQVEIDRLRQQIQDLEEDQL